MAAIVLVIALTAPGAASGQEINLDEHPVAPFPRLIANGEERPPWVATTNPDTLVLENTGNPNAVRYYYADDRGAYGRRSITVLVETQGDANSHGGILYGLNRDATSYYMFVLEGSGTIAVYLRNADGLRRVLSGRAVAGVNELTIVETADQAEFFANGESFFSSLGLSNLGFGEGRVGILGYGEGRYVFHDYEETVRPGLALALDAWVSLAKPAVPEAERAVRRLCLDAAITRAWDRQILADAFMAAVDHILTEADWEDRTEERPAIASGLVRCGITPERLFQRGPAH
jgi:hypothetical protein